MHTFCAPFVGSSAPRHLDTGWSSCSSTRSARRAVGAVHEACGATQQQGRAGAYALQRCLIAPPWSAGGGAAGPYIAIAAYTVTRCAPAGEMSPGQRANLK